MLFLLESFGEKLRRHADVGGRVWIPPLETAAATLFFCYFSEVVL